MKYIAILISALFLLVNCSEDSDDSDTNPNNQEQNSGGDNTDNSGQQGNTGDTGNTGVTGSTGATGDTSAKVTYDKDIAPLITLRCFTCHNSPTANGAPSGSTWVNFSIVSTNAAKINSRVANGTMPNSQGGGALIQSERDLIAQWIADGLLEN